MLCILPFVLCACLPSVEISKNYIGSVYVGLCESGLCVFRELCPVGFLVIAESPSVFL